MTAVRYSTEFIVLPVFIGLGCLLHLKPMMKPVFVHAMLTHYKVHRTLAPPPKNKIRKSLAQNGQKTGRRKVIATPMIICKGSPTRT